MVWLSNESIQSGRSLSSLLLCRIRSRKVEKYNDHFTVANAAKIQFCVERVVLDSSSEKSNTTVLSIYGWLKVTS